MKLFYPLPFNIVSPIHFKTGGLVDLSLATALSFGAIYVLFQPFVNELTHQWVSHFLNLNKIWNEEHRIIST